VRRRFPTGLRVFVGDERFFIGSGTGVARLHRVG
jgi:hypothetical protein